MEVEAIFSQNWNESERASYDICDDFKLKQNFGLHGFCICKI